MNIQREIEKDGISGGLYHLLWLKNEAFQQTLKLNIPDTIIYFNAKPIFWYYSTNDGLRKKKKENITNANIYEYFEKIDPNIGISAVYIYNEISKEETKIVCKYLDLMQLKDFLQDEKKPSEGILQRFILPFGLNNCMIQVVWGQKVCVFLKRMNKRNVYDKRLDLYERCCTFDGADHYSENVPVKGHLSNFLKIEIQKIVEHIASISYDKFLISRMILFIKEDVKGKIWILWSSSMRIEGSLKPRKPVNSCFNFLNLSTKPLALQTNLTLPKNIDPLFSTNTLHPQEIQKKVHCLRCNLQQHEYNFIQIPYKLLIKEHDHKIRKEEDFFNIMKTYAINPIEVRNANEEENEILRNLKKGNLFYIKSDNDKIPVLIRRLHPKLSNKEYVEIKRLMQFQQQEIPICQDCYMELIQYLEFAGGQDFLLETIKQKSKKQKHKSTDLTIKQLESFKRPYYKENKEMHQTMKGICSYFKQKRCAADIGNSHSMIPSLKKSDITNKIQKNSTFHSASSNETFLKEGSKLSFKKDSLNEEMDSIMNKYLKSNEKEESSYQRLEKKIRPLVCKEKQGRKPGKSGHSLWMSMDSTKTNITNLKNEY